MATNLNINKTDVYYTLIKGNVYACRFKAVIVDCQGIGERNLDLSNDLNDNDLLEQHGTVRIENGENIYPFRLKNSDLVLFDRYGDKKYSNLGIEYILLEIAGGIGECHWQSYHGSKEFSPYKIYRSVEDCIDNNNPVFIKGYNGYPALPEVYKVSLSELLPENVFYENPNCDIYGRIKWHPYSYRWNGTKAERTYVNVRNTHYGYYSAYHNMLLDLLEGKFIFDEGYLDGCYATEEECKKHNAVKVFTF